MRFTSPTGATSPRPSRFLQAKRGALPNSAGVIAALAEVKSNGSSVIRRSAQQLAQEALKKNSDYRPAMVTIARDHYRNRRLDLALYALQAIFDGFGDENPPRDRTTREAHYLRGIILKEEGRRTAPMNEFKAAVAGRPDLVERGSSSRRSFSRPATRPRRSRCSRGAALRRQQRARVT